MQRRRLGPLEVSLVGLGCNNFGGRLDAAGTQAVIDAALDSGINFFDTADIYGGTHSEELLGQALGKRRGEVLIATKLGMELGPGRKGARPAYVRQACDDSLRRLGTDRIDLYQLHQPDPEVPIADTLGAFAELIQAGKVRAVGCSNFSAAQLREAAAVPGARFVSVQNEYSLLVREPEREVLAECVRQGQGFLPYFPLASGLLTGKVRAGQPPPAGTRLAGPRAARWLSESNLAKVEALRSLAEARGHTLLELAMSWLASRPAVASVIAGATQPAQVRANVAAAGWVLTPADLAAVDAISAVTGSAAGG